jgi:hypothetical protein
MAELQEKIDLLARWHEFEISDTEELDRWQIEVLQHKGNSSIRAGRQVGKSTVVARKACDFALEHPGSIQLIIAAAQRQSSQLFDKTLARLERFNQFLIKKAGGYKENPTLSNRQNLLLRREFDSKFGIFDGCATRTEVRLKHPDQIGLDEKDRDPTRQGSIIYSFPAGKTGVFIRGLTVDHLIADEAAFIPEAVWLSVKAMIAVSRQMRGLGWETLLSTPFGKGGHFYETQCDKDYRQWHISSEICQRIPRDFLAKEKSRLSKAEYAQEYLGEFVDEFNQFFPTELIKKCMTFMDWDRKAEYNANAAYYLGIDPARYGEDEAAFVTGEMNGDKLRIVHCEERRKIQGKAITSLRDFTCALDLEFKYKRIFNDDTGVGGGLTDLLQEELGKSKVIGLNNASRRYQEGNEEKKKGILKEDLYSNALAMMERSAAQIDKKEKGELEMINNLKLLRSLKSVQFEYTKERNLRIHGNYTHLAEAFVRCCWSKQSKGLKLFIY